MKLQDLIPYINNYTKISIVTASNNIFTGSKEALLNSDIYVNICTLTIGEISTEKHYLRIEI